MNVDGKAHGDKGEALVVLDGWLSDSNAPAAAPNGQPTTHSNDATCPRWNSGRDVQKAKESMGKRACWPLSLSSHLGVEGSRRPSSSNGPSRSVNQSIMLSSRYISVSARLDATTRGGTAETASFRRSFEIGFPFTNLQRTCPSKFATGEWPPVLLMQLRTRSTNLAQVSNQPPTGLGVPCYLASVKCLLQNLQT